MLSTDSISNTQSSMTSFSGSINERSRSHGISTVESTLRIAELCFLEKYISSTSLESQSEFSRMQRTKSHASVLQIGSIDSSDDVAGKPHQPMLASTSSKSIRPTPLDFVHFLPWLCAEWQSPQFVNVISVVQEEYVSVLQDRHTSKGSRGSKGRSKRKDAAPKIMESSVSVVTSKVSHSSLVDVPLIITASFDAKAHLVEIAISERYLDIHRKTLQAISVCIPFHCLLSRLTLQWAKLDNIHMYEISKFLPNSYLTDIILDDTIGQPDYDVLLSKKSPLVYLSLNRCLIDDDQCKKIASNIELGAGGATLNVLELGSNFITDVGAIAIAESLRRNRNLMHLNLSGNMITDEGAVPLLCILMKFQVRLDELMETKKKKRQYVQKKLKTYEVCFREVMLRRIREENIRKKSRVPLKTDQRRSTMHKKLRRSSPSSDDGKDNDFDEATELTLKRVGEFVDAFDERSTIIEKEWTYCTGNFVLCSLNLAYNNLSYHSIQKIHEVLKYQYEMMTSEGLKRINFSGNLLPVDCDLYDEITRYLLNSVAIQKKGTTKSLKVLKPSKIKMV